jgi:AraC-like DNA-binding protein
MKLKQKRELIEVWRPDNLQIELRRGFGVATPVPRHWHEEYQFCFIQSGPGEINYRGSNLPTPPTSLFMVHPGEVHSNRPYEQAGCSYRTLFIGAELMRRAAVDVCDRESGLPFFPTAVTFDEQLVQKYLEVHFAFEQLSSNLERGTSLLDLLSLLITRFSQSTRARRSIGTERLAVNRASDYLAEHFAENVSLETLSAIANLSPYHFNRVFSEQVGMPPHAFQTQVRVCKAKTLLRRGRPITQTAAQTGFADQSHLNRHFKRLTGVTPGQFIQNSKNVQDSF